ncbi:MAG: dipeptidyl-peptidase-4 [Cyclobacteriaceae bacterium]|jgi:dipeptidyl-peptidase-4
MRKFLFGLMVIVPLLAHAQKQITIENIYDGTFDQESFASLNWMNDGQFYTALVSNQVVKYDVTTQKQVAVLVDGNSLNIQINDYEFSNDESRIVLLTEKEMIYRRSFTGEYYIYTLVNKNLKRVSNKGRQSYATISPDNKKIAFVRDNNIFFMELGGMFEFPLTKDGEVGSIINGSSDWVYEEEFSLTKAFEWSPDGKKIAYLRFDESAVKEYNLQYWDQGAKYPRDYRYKYPKTGEKNSEVSVYIFNLDSKKKVKVDLGKEEDTYVPRIQWTKNPNLLSIMQLSRLQNKLNVYHADANTGRALVAFYERAEKYLDVTETCNLYYLNNKTQFIFSTTERDGFNHFYLHNMDGQHVGPITKGTWEVDDFIGVDESKKTPVLYYTSTEDSPMERHVYKVDIYGKGKTKLSMSPGMNSVDMSKDFKYYFVNHNSSTKPKSVTLVSAKGNKVIDTLINNTEASQRSMEYELSQKQFFTFETPGRTLLNGYFLKPSEFDSTQQYPVLIFQYSGPGSQNVLNTWEGSNYYWHQMLVQKGYVIAVIDPRGTGGRGEAFKKQTYRQMGNLETADLITGAKFIGSLPFFDKDRIGIWGWSYGGYASSVATMRGNGVFKACISVAPFSWEHYDTVYSERYMQRPEDNESGYKGSSLLKYADKLKGNYLLIHGTGDDNVHYQVSMNLVNKLVEEGKQFDTFFYPDKAHGIGGYNTRIHLFTMMTKFLEEKL